MQHTVRQKNCITNQKRTKIALLFLIEKSEERKKGKKKEAKDIYVEEQKPKLLFISIVVLDGQNKYFVGLSLSLDFQLFFYIFVSNIKK